MNSYLVTVEETVTKTFEVHASSREEAYDITEKKYRSGEFVLDPGDCIQCTMSIPDDISGEIEESWDIY